jgi:amino acid transporter
MLFPLLSFLQVSNSSAKVLTWLVNLITAGGLIDFIVMCVTYLAFYYACKAQGVDRKTLPYCGWFQPYSAYIGLVGLILIVFTYGYSVFLPGHWKIDDFFSYYTMVGVAPVLYIGWKVIHRTNIIPAHKVDLVWDAPIIDAYESSFTSPPLGFWTEMLQLIGLKRHARDRRNSVPAEVS